MNARDQPEGRNIGTVVPDPERASLVTTAFELHATRNFTNEQLARGAARASPLPLLP